MSFFILLLFLTNSLSIDLVLPLSEKDSKNFIILNKRSVTNQLFPLGEFLFDIISYEGNGEIIRKIFYHGVLIFQDLEERPSNFRRKLLILNCREYIIIILVSKLNSTTYERVFYIQNESILDIMREPGRLTSILDGTDQSLIAKIIKNILTRDPAKRKSYDDLDQVDDVPYLIKGNDISPEKTKKEVEQIINNPTNGSGISEQDLKEAGPSETDANDADASLLSRQFSNKLRKEDFNPNSDSQNE
ncbi:Theileria-specific conserved protein, putative [Theileria annulata]|uniref:Theileria-specific conserved protein, putative n=1 Tax=Theileria annulata TaxID=5874 RepID=Q4UBD5_THEAN|nr:Theileria-specific conserved protein, putative [Theileria annulata]CAI75866.1 Theileria-specific conserved protein, putative [Theileria annulata]|eukprot:XP_955342.1 Theileria-specific conserved protein, putative [Theileria annulata]